MSLVKLAQNAENVADQFESFGDALALDNGVALVGAPFDNEGGFNAGAAYIFELAR